jgi:hypothetical protein
MSIDKKPENLNPDGSETDAPNEPVGQFTKYAEAGFLDHILPIIPPGAKLHKSSKLNADHLGKIPGIRKPDGTWVGRHEWTKETIAPRTIRTWDKWVDASIGIRTGEVVGVDIDVTDGALSEAIGQAALDILGPAPFRIGNHPKRLLPYQTATPRSKIRNDFTHPDTGEVHAVEILGTGQQFVADGIHPKTGKPYRWEGGDLIDVGLDGLTEITPDQVNEFLDAAQDLMVSNGYTVKTKHSNKTGKRKYIGDPAMTGDPELVHWALDLIGNEFDYDEWIKFAAAIKAALGGDMEHYGIYEDWCLLYDGNDPEIAKQKWDSFTNAKIGFPFIMKVAKKIAREQDDFDFLDAYENYELQLAAEEFQSDADFEEAEEENSTSLEVDINAILSPPGLVGEIAKYHDANSVRETPIFGVATGLATVSALAANNFVFLPKVGPPSATNLYLMMVGATGLGKEHPRTVVKEALRTAGASNMDVDAASEPALLRHLTEYPNGIWLKDEIGRHLEFAANPNGGHQYALITLFTSLYGLPLSSTSRRTYSDGKHTIDPVSNPYMTIFSTSTRESLARALNSSAVVDGTLNRFIVIHDPNMKPKFQDKPLRGMSNKLERKIKKLYTDGGNAAVATAFKDELGTDTSMTEIRGRFFTSILPDDGVMDVLLEFRAATDDKRAEGGLEAPLWARAYENALRVASVVAIGDSNIRKPVMTVAHAEWAITFIQWATQNSISLMDNVSDNEVERVSKEIENFVHKTIQNPDPDFKKHNVGGGVPKSQITRRFRGVKGPELEQHLKTLCAAGLLKQDRNETSGRTATVFRLPTGKMK